MASPDQLTALRRWFDDHGGYLHPAVTLQWNPERGVHCRASSDLAPESRICTVPHALALSSLNALVDDTFSAWRNCGLPPQAMGYFYLMHQYVHRERSFWKPYLDTLPAPASEHRTPFWFDGEDLEWLEDTDVLFTYRARLATHQGFHARGLAVMAEAGIDATPYSWDLYRWAMTMFTSRSFSSRALQPHDGKSWTAYKSGPDGRRQTVLLDMSRASAEELDFPVLFPVMDIPNHSHDARVDWTFDPARFTMAVRDAAARGAEVLNNYGPKSNDELLLGYGFCVPHNPNDRVLMTLKPPPDRLQHEMRELQPGYFDRSGRWSSERATFGLKRLGRRRAPSPADVFQEVPAALLELLAHVVRFERRLPFELVPHRTDDASPARHDLPFTARMIVASMVPKLQKLQASTPPTAPRNGRQRQAQIYRDSQLDILRSVVGGLRTYLRSLLRTRFPRPHPLPREPFLTTLDGLLQLLDRHSPEAAREFVDGIAASAGARDLEQLRAAGWEDDMFVLLICACQIAFGFDLPAYCHGGRADAAAAEEEEEEEAGPVEAELEPARGLLDLVAAARQAVPGPHSIWHGAQWTAPFVARVGARIFVHASFPMMLEEGEGEEGEAVARPVLYVPGLRARPQPTPP